MKLSQDLEGEKVRILATNHEFFEGVVGDYIYPEDNEPEGIACIILDDCPQRPGMCLGFNEDEIVSVEIIE